MKQTLKDNFCSEMRNFEVSTTKRAVSKYIIQEIKSKRSQQSDEKHSYNKQGILFVAEEVLKISRGRRRNS